jgi:hypothetical protein
MPICYLLTVDGLSATSKPLCYVSVAETETEAVANVADGYRDFLGRGQRPRVSGSLLPEAARRLGIPMDRRGHVSSVCEHVA